MIDIVIDTCTLVHANNPESGYQVHSMNLIQKMMENDTLLVVDEGFELDETTNKSYLALEYLKHLSLGMLGYNFIQFMALQQRIKFVSRKIPEASKHFIEQLISNKKDRMFLRVTYNSEEKIIVSHDYEDYKKGKRKKIRKEIGINIVDAEDVIESLTPVQQEEVVEAQLPLHPQEAVAGAQLPPLP
ncbi:MAG: hypothetical protein JSU01_01120 [Bacteroidetes bacterium]|nr:hypothetical protein [Bacteroidota bacterium]